MKAKLLTAIIFPIAVPVLTFAQWSAPLDISPSAVSAGLNESMGSCIGTSGDTVHVVWTDKLSSTKAVLYYIRSSDTGLTWNNPIAITNPGGNAWNPAIAVNGSSVHVVWREINPVGGHRASWYKHSLDGGNTWGPNIFLDSTADWPAISVSGNKVYVVNDSMTAASPYNTEIFLLRSLDNGVTWSAKQQLTFSVGRSEDEAIHAESSHIHMSWNDNRNGYMELFYKESADYGVTWGPDVSLIPGYVYGPAVYSNGANVDGICSKTPNNFHPQIHLIQSSDTGVTWGADINLTNDTLNTYIYPTIVRCGSDLHVTYIKAGVGGQYLHSGNGGATWDPPFTFLPGNAAITAFSAYTGCALHIICVNNANHHVYYVRNPIGNAGHCPAPLGLSANTNNVSCNGGNNGSAAANVSGGTTPYTYQWSNGQTTQTATGLVSGNYTITVTDANTNTITATVSITQPAALAVNVAVVNASSCIANDGSLTANVSGGTSPYNYSWSNGGTTASITGLAQGTYTLTITDANNCTDISVYTVSCPNAVTDLSPQDVFTVYPNPSNGDLRLTINEVRFINADMEIYNVFGEKMYSEKISNHKSVIINLNLATGIYFLNIKTEKESFTQKISIQK
ncbi:MAG: T9SS type A sorting domain-containing protein [Bacteroidetes bacterium]|nr:T9SS type A sorting domain-containing protein [Bacteroidota bacterium]